MSKIEGPAQKHQGAPKDPVSSGSAPQAPATAGTEDHYGTPTQSTPAQRAEALNPAAPEPLAAPAPAQGAEPQTERTGRPPKNKRTGGMTHLLEAIGVNCRRAPYYARKSRGRSLPVSFMLVASELISLFTLGLLDLWGMVYNRSGVGVIAKDFVSMKNISSADTPPRHRGISTSDQRAMLNARVEEYSRHARSAIGENGFQEVADLTRALLNDLDTLEDDIDCSFPMHRHLMESIGLASANAVGYARKSKGETNRLCRTFLRLQILTLNRVMTLDGQAQRCHALGAGILENDVPEIHF